MQYPPATTYMGMISSHNIFAFFLSIQKLFSHMFDFLTVILPLKINVIQIIIIPFYKWEN